MPRYDLGSVTDFAENTPTKASTACRDLVVVRQGEAFFLLDHACQHLGAPLSEAIVDGDALVCPWHRSLIRLSDGQMMEPPGCRHHRRYEHVVEDGRLLVDIEPEESSYREVEFSEKDHGRDDPATIVILGAGAAGMSAAQTLAEEGYRGDITVISHEDEATFDRTKLSKGLLHERGEAYVGALSDLRGHGLTYRQATVESVSLDDRSVTLEGGETISADALILATGGKPVELDMPGSDLNGIMTLRSLKDAMRLEQRAGDATRCAVVGAGFIGMETASLLSGEDMDVTVIAQEDIPFAPIIGERLGKRLVREQEDAGVRFVGGAEVTGFKGDDGVKTVELASGESVDAELVIMAAGIKPRTDLLPGNMVDDDGGISVNRDLSVDGAASVFVAGDIARLDTRFGKVRSEHWRWAQQLGRRAARSALGIEEDGEIAPFFWTKQQAPGSYVYVGHTEDFDDIAYEGEPDNGEFVAYFVKDGMVPAVFAFGMTDKVSRIEREMARRGPLPTAELGI